MTDPGCAVAIDQSGSTIRVTLSGEIDLAEVDMVRAALGPFASSQVDVDLTAITFMDSSGLQCLLQLQGEASDGGGRLIVCAVSPAVQRLLQLSGTSDRLLGE